MAQINCSAGRRRGLPIVLELRVPRSSRPRPHYLSPLPDPISLPKNHLRQPTTCHSSSSSTWALAKGRQPPEATGAASGGERERWRAGGEGGDVAGGGHPDQARGVPAQGVLEEPRGSSHLRHHGHRAPRRAPRLILAGRASFADLEAAVPVDRAAPSPFASPPSRILSP